MYILEIYAGIFKNKGEQKYIYAFFPVHPQLKELWASHQMTVVLLICV